MLLLIIWQIFFLFSKPNVCHVSAQCVKNFIKIKKWAKSVAKKQEKGYHVKPVVIEENLKYVHVESELRYLEVAE